MSREVTPDTPLESILAARRSEPTPPPVGFSLQPGTAAWARYGTNNDNGDGDGGGGRDGAH